MSFGLGKTQQQIEIARALEYVKRALYMGVQ